MKISRIIFPCLVLCAIISCSRGPQKPDGMPELFPVKITVQQEGQALADASVILLRRDTPSKWVAGGRTDVNGICIARTQSFHPGAPAGTYKVMVSKILDETSEDKDAKSDPSGMSRSVGNSFDLVDVKYKSVQTTDLEVVVEEKKNEFVLDVGQAVKKKIAASGM